MRNPASKELVYSGGTSIRGGASAMILDTILSDHQAGRDLFALAGNSAFEGYAERADLFERFNACGPPMRT